jgi:hypothetical protein
VIFVLPSLAAPAFTIITGVVLPVAGGSLAV